jgi:hypothetical protein
MMDFLDFKQMITPTFIRIIFLIGVVLSVIFGLGMIVAGAQSRLGGGGLMFMGVLYLFVGPLVCRIYCELLIVIFRVLDELTAIRQHLAPPTGQGFPVIPLPPGN